MTVNFAHCFFEQSGTFKREFANLGIPAKDYDILNDFGETDVQVDLFNQIELAFIDKNSIFDDIRQDDLIFAFFPCTYFCENNVMFFCGTNIDFRQLSNIDKIRQIMSRADERHRMYTLLLKLCAIVEERRLKMIVENPYNPHHYLRYNFPYKPAVIDMNRRRSGDYYTKPTQYIFVNCSDSGMKSIQLDKPMKFVNCQTQVNRSMISPDYARNFICDHILGMKHEHSVLTLF